MVLVICEVQMGTKVILVLYLPSAQIIEIANGKSNKFSTAEKKKKEKNLKNRRDSHILHNTYTCKMFKAVREVR